MKAILRTLDVSDITEGARIILKKKIYELKYEYCKDDNCVDLNTMRNQLGNSKTLVLEYIDNNGLKHIPLSYLQWQYALDNNLSDNSTQYDFEIKEKFGYLIELF